MLTNSQNNSSHPRIRRGFLAIHFVLLLVIAGLLGGYFTLNAATSNRNKPLVFQGRITNASYVPLSDGSNVFLKISVYTSATGSDTNGDGTGTATCQWATGTNATGSVNCRNAAGTEPGSSAGVQVTVTRGVFTVALGDTTLTNMPALPLDFNAASYYIGITACSAATSGCDAEMTPRVRIGGAAYAYNADELDGINSTSFLRFHNTATGDTVSSGTATSTIWRAGAYSAQANSENIDLDLDFSTNTFSFTGSAGGTINNQRTMLVRPRTYTAGTGAFTLINASTLTIGGPPASSGGNLFISRANTLELYGPTTGSFLFMDYPSATTLSGQIFASDLDLNTNVTFPTDTSVSLDGYRVNLPSVTNSNALTHTLIGLRVRNGGVNTQITNTNGSAQINWTGLDIAKPALTQTTGTNTSTGIAITSGTITSGTSYSITADAASGNVGFGDTTPNYVLELSRSTGIANAFSMSADDVTHGLTALHNGTFQQQLETGTFFQIGVLNGGGGGTGGALLTGVSDSDSPGMRIVSVIGNADPTDTTPALYLSGAKTNGTTGRTTIGNPETLLYLSNNDTVVLTIDGSGDLGLGDITPNGMLDLLSSTAASTTSIILSHTNGNDPVINFELTEGTGAFSLGVDNDVSGDPFKISASGALGTSDMLILDSRTTTGAVSAISISPPSGASIAFAEAANSTYTTLNLSTPALSISGATVDNITSSWSSYLFRQPGDLTHSASGVTINDAATMRIGGPQQVAGGVNITNDYALRIEAGESVASVGTVTNAYGLYVDKPTGGINNYAAIFAGNIGTPLVGIGTATPRTGLDVDGSVAFGAMMAVSITSNATNAISPSASTVFLLSTTGDNNYTLAANSVTDGVSAQIIMLMVDSTETNTITIRDHSSNSSNVQTAGDVDRVLGARDILVLLFDGGEWVEVSYSNN